MNNKRDTLTITRTVLTAGAALIAVGCGDRNHNDNRNRDRQRASRRDGMPSDRYQAQERRVQWLRDHRHDRNDSRGDR